MNIRALRREDRPHIEKVLRDTNMFTEAEVQVALELIDIYLNQKEQRDYLLHCAVDEHDRPCGYVCFGPTPLTVGTYDLYWIAVAPQWQGSGVGKALTEFVERHALAANGRMIMIETSSQPKYEPTRQFYLRRNYPEIARIPDFYSPGDDRVIYCKKL